MATKHRIPRQTRNVVVAGVFAAVLVVGSSALALANGAFATPEADRVGTFATIQAQLTPTTKALPASSSSVRPSVGTTARPAPGTAPEPTLGSTSVSDHRSTPVTAAGATLVPNHDSVPEPTDAPEVEPDTTTRVSHGAPSTVPRTHEDDHEAPEIPETDD